VSDRVVSGASRQSAAPARQEAGHDADADMRFRRQSRLLKRGDFTRVYRNGRRHFGEHLTFFYLPQAQEESGAELGQGSPSAVGARVGLTVSRALGNAVARNRLKRRVREAVRLCLAELPAPVDVVINPKRSAAEAEFSVLRTEVEKAFRAIAHRRSVTEPTKGPPRPTRGQRGKHEENASRPR
ncbi:MAG: ribonuclease P protein component, partial [Candidatus Korobacteraceae bacterium]